MEVVVRTYTGKGPKELFSLLEQRKTDVEKLMRSVKGSRVALLLVAARVMAAYQ